MGLKLNGNYKDFKDESFGITADWLITLFCIIYAIVGIVFFYKKMMSDEFTSLIGIYVFIILIVYWVLRNKEINSIKATVKSMNLTIAELKNPNPKYKINIMKGNKSLKEKEESIKYYESKQTKSIKEDEQKVNEYESKLTKFRKLMLILSNVPGFFSIIYLGVNKISKK